MAQATHSASVGLDVRLAVDFEQAAHDVYLENFPCANVHAAAVEDYFNGELGAELTKVETATKISCGRIDLLIGGPPCQGHSDLNNHTRRDDPKNALYARMARAVEVLDPTIVMIENVPAVQRDKRDVVGATTGHLEKLGYVVAARTVPLHLLGVAQSRRRHVLLASKVATFDPKDLLDGLAVSDATATATLKWAIGDLEDVEDPKGYDIPPRANKDNCARMQHLVDNDLHDLENSLRPKCHHDDHSYKSMYGRLWWNRPAQTITSGFGSIGQGRYMHPSRVRALTGHEAARIQGFPDYFSFNRCTKRADLATMIGNAVPPALARAIATAALPVMVGVDLNGGSPTEEVVLSVSHRRSTRNPSR